MLTMFCSTRFKEFFVIEKESFRKNGFCLFCLNVVLFSVITGCSNVSGTKKDNKKDVIKKEKVLFSKENKESKKSSYKNFGIIISGPSGVGKTTIIEELVKTHPELYISVSTTTRQKRKSEIDGKSYYFVDKKKFKELLRKNEFIEYAENYGNYYGSPKKNYTESINNGKDVVFILSVEGMRNALKNKEMDFVTIFIRTSSDNTLLQRLKNRATETKEQIKKRFRRSKYELSFAQKYDYTVYNDNFNSAVKTIEAIYLAEKFKRIK